MRSPLRICLLLFCSLAAARAQTIGHAAFGMHIQCTPGGGQNADCALPTPWPSVVTAPQPGEPVGSLRMHDDGTKFGNIQAHRTASCNEHITSGCAWAAFDEWIRLARRHHVELLYTFSRTPEWACAKHSGCAPSDVPEDSAFLNFVRAVRDRRVDGRPAGCRLGEPANSGCIRYWEVWNEPNNGRSAFCGSISDLVHLTRLIAESVRETDATAQIVAPGAGYTSNYNGSSCSAGGISGQGACGHWGKGNGNVEAYVCEYLRQSGGHPGDFTGKDYIDIVGWHAYPSHSRRQSMAEDNVTRRMENLRTAMRDNGLKPCEHAGESGCKPLWITESSWGTVSNGGHNDSETANVSCGEGRGCPRIGPANDDASADCSSDRPPLRPGCWQHDQAAFLVKLYTLAFGAGVDRVFWYWWDGQPWGTLYCKSPGAAAGCSADAAAHPYPQRAALAWGESESWLEGRRVLGCRQGDDGTVRCDLSDSSGHRSAILWNSRQERTLAPEGGVTEIIDIYGNTHAVRNAITIGHSPVLLTAP